MVWIREDGPQPRWELGSDVVEKLATAPEFEVESWSVPEQVDYGEQFEVSVTVANVGDRDGRFLTTLGIKQGSVGVPETSVKVPPGESVTHTITLGPEYVEGGEFRVVLEWGTGRRDTIVEVTGSETETGRRGRPGDGIGQPARPIEWRVLASGLGREPAPREG